MRSTPVIDGILWFGVVNVALVGGCSVESEVSSVAQRSSLPIVFGADDRVEYGELSNPQWVQWADATASLFPQSNVTCEGTSCGLTTFPHVSGNVGGSELNLCNDEPFRGQEKGAHCTAFLIGDDRFATAGHCIQSQESCNKTRVIFGFAVEEPGGPARTAIPERDVYRCTELVAQYFSGGVNEEDFAVFRVDRAVDGRLPLALRRTGTIADGENVVSFGHPQMLPLKVSTTGAVKANYSGMPKFEASLDASPGNSGSPVVNIATGLVEGIITSGPDPDYVAATNEDGSLCARSRVCTEDGCFSGPFASWIGVTRIQSVVAVLEDRSCHDLKLNGNESDVDCGGTECAPCKLGQSCRAITDCGYDLLCENAVCVQAPECVADSDCIGPMTPACVVGHCENSECRLDYDACECTNNQECDDSDPCTEDLCFSRTMACIHIPGHCPACTAESAIDLGAPGETTTVPNNACLRIRDEYPFWWGTNREMILQTTTGGDYPVPFGWSNSCSGGTGAETFTGAWQQHFLSPTSANCATLISLLGTGAGNVSLWYFGR